MTFHIPLTSLVASSMLLLCGTPAPSQADVADVASQERLVDEDENMRYFLIGANPDEKKTAKPKGLVVIMPGGNGGADFLTFVKRIYKNAVPEGYLVAQPVSVMWTPEQKIIWPTKDNRVKKMKRSTEEFVEAVIRDVQEQHKLDKDRIYTMSWSSSGPAAYAISLQKKTAVRGSYIAMSVFKPKYLPSLKRAKGKAYFLDHSPQDKVCPYSHAELAVKQLKKAKAAVVLETYQGGHGWRGNLYGRMRKGIEWLEEETGS